MHSAIFTLFRRLLNRILGSVIKILIYLLFIVYINSFSLTREIQTLVYISFDILLGVQLCFRHFFSEIRGFIIKNWLYIYDSKYCPSPLLSPIFRVVYESRVAKTNHLLRLSTNRFNFLLLHKTGNAGQPGRVSLIETSDSQREQRLENTTGGVRLLISTFPSMS